MIDVAQKKKKIKKSNNRKTEIYTTYNKRAGYVRETYTNAISVKVCNVPISVQCPGRLSRWPTNCRLIVCMYVCARSYPKSSDTDMCLMRVWEVQGIRILLLSYMHVEQKRFLPTKKIIQLRPPVTAYREKKYLNNDRRFEFLVCRATYTRLL